MFFHTMKASYLQQNPEQLSPTETPLKITLSFAKFINSINILSVEKLPQNHPFLINYLCKFFRKENEELVVSVARFTETLKVKNFKVSEIAMCMSHWLSDQDSPILQLIDIWCPYIHQEIQTVDKVDAFLIRQIEKFTTLIVSILEEFYPQLLKQSTKTWLEFKLLNRISRNTFFKQLMNTYIAKFDKDKGHDAEFTQSQIFQSVRELEELVNFPHLTQPFSRSIQHMILFYKEHRLKSKIKILIQAVKEAREEIKEYREEFQLGSAAVGSDQLCPVVNFVCERTGYNVLAAVSYINAFLGQDLERRQKLLGEVSIEAAYCLQLVEAVSGVYCHASQFILP